MSFQALTVIAKLKLSNKARKNKLVPKKISASRKVPSYPVQVDFNRITRIRNDKCQLFKCCMKSYFEWLKSQQRIRKKFDKRLLQT